MPVKVIGGGIMDIFNIIAGTASILSLFISVFVASKVIKISQNINLGDSNKIGKQRVKGNENTVAGRDITK
jgi:hypothetical protein